MDADALSQLNTHFQIPEALHFDVLPNGFCIAHLHSQHGAAAVSLQGGHVVHWQPVNQAPVLWLSRDARFESGKSIRGGIPVCWPWFGPHATTPAFPAHGFARTAVWEVIASNLEDDGSVQLGLRMVQGQGHPYAADDIWLELSVRLGKTLSLELTTKNFGAEPVQIGEALHTYFRIGDIADIAIEGLDNNEYWDTVGGVVKRKQEGEIRFALETDRVYINSPVEVSINDPLLQRRIHVRKSGSQSTVVWNPWTDKAARMGDLGQPDGWREFVCVESANAWDNRITIEPGMEHCLSVEYEVSAL